ncbi:WD40 repeat-containing protein [Tanacetum coccineum]
MSYSKAKEISLPSGRGTRVCNLRARTLLWQDRILLMLLLRSLAASRVGCAVLPSLHPLSITSNSSIRRDDGRKFHPRQFEYHPTNPNLMVIGAVDGEVVVVNHESEKIVRYIPSHGAMNIVLGLCWLKKYPSKVKVPRAVGVEVCVKLLGMLKGRSQVRPL